MHGAHTRDITLVTVSFPLVDDRKTSLLAWTTTPWTLPSNLALCVHPDYTYVKIYDQERDQNFILHEGLLRTLYKDPKKAKFKKLGTFKGADMNGWRYVPLFEYFTEQVGHIGTIACHRNMLFISGYTVRRQGIPCTRRYLCDGCGRHRHRTSGSRFW